MLQNIYGEIVTILTPQARRYGWKGRPWFL